MLAFTFEFQYVGKTFTCCAALLCGVSGSVCCWLWPLGFIM